jgi:acetoin utilization protein AcuC
MSNRVCVYYGDELRKYGFGEGHPFGPDRIDAFWTEFVARGFDGKVDIGLPVSCTRNELLLFHTPDYIDKLQRLSKLGEGYLDFGDTPAFHGVYEAACTVTGTVLDALEHLLSGKYKNIFIPIAGLHHARRDRAEGFCAVNDIGVAIEWLKLKGIHKIAYIDIDAHHGDGVFYGFENDPAIFFADIHEDGKVLFPGTGDKTETGQGEAAGYKLNIPMAPDADDEQFYKAWEKVEDFLANYEPEIFLLQAGADSIAGDPITHLAYSPKAHAHATERLCELAERTAQGRLLTMGGGGYNRANLAKAWTAVVETMLVHQG